MAIMITEKQLMQNVRCLFNRFSPNNSKLIFASTFIAGVICHIYFLVHNLPNGDTMSRFYDNRNLLYEGRWFFETAGLATSPFALSWVNGIIAIFFISISAVIIVDILNITGKTAGVLTGVLLVCYPAVASGLSYIHRSAIFFFACFLAILSVKITKEFKYGFVVGAVVLAFSLGIYQAYLSIAMMLVVITLALSIVSKPEQSIKQIFKKISRYAVLFVGGFAIYQMVLFVMLNVNQTELTNYQGIEVLTGNATFNLTNSVFAVLNEVYLMIVELPFVFLKQPLTFGCIILIAVCALWLLIKNKIYKSPIKLVVLALLLIAVPLSLAPSKFLSPDMWHHAVLRISLSLVFIATLPFAETFYRHLSKTKCLVAFSVKCLSLLMISVICWNFFLVSNINYFNAHQRFEKDYSLVLSVSNRIFETEDFEISDKVCVFGFPYNSGSYENSNYIGYAEQNGFGLFGLSGNTTIMNSMYGFATFARTYFGIAYNMVMMDEYYALLENPEVSSMPVWPYEGSVKEIDGVYVVKLGNGF